MSVAQAKLLASSLELLEKEKQELLSAIDSHLAKVFQLGLEWIEERDQHRISLSDVRATVEEALELIMSKKEGFTVSESDKTQKPSASCQSQPQIVSPSPRKTSIPDINTDLVHKIIAKMDNMEKTISVLQMTTDSMTEKKNVLEKRCQNNEENMSKQLTYIEKHCQDNEENMSKQLTDVEKHYQDNEETMSKRLTDVEKRCQDNEENMSKRLTDIEKRCQDNEENMSKRMTDVEKRMKKNNKKQTDLLKENNTKLVQMETELRELSAKHDETEEENMAWKKKVKSQIDDGRSQTQSMLADVNRKVEVLESVSEDLLARIETNSSSVGDLTASRTRATEKLRELEDGVKTLEERRLKDMRIIDDKFTDVDRRAGMSNILIDKRMRSLEQLNVDKRLDSLEKLEIEDRLDSLEKLRALLNRNVKNRGENIEKLNKLEKDFNEMYPKLKDLETRCTRKLIGFNARSYRNKRLSNSVFKLYNIILSNHEGHFDPANGVFIAPIDGIYVTFVGLRQDGGDGIFVSVKHGMAGVSLDSDGSDVCEAWTNRDGRSDSSMGVVEMKVGERLYVWVNSCSSETYVWPLNFSCYFIG